MDRRDACRQGEDGQAGRLSYGAHHLQLQGLASAGWWRASTGQCSSGSRAFARQGQPQPSMAWSRKGFRRNGRPQYDTPFDVTHITQRAQMDSRRTQSVELLRRPSRRI